MKNIFTADRFRTWLGVAFVALLTLGSFWILEVVRRNDVEGNSRASARDEPDYYVEDFDFIRLPNNGKASFHIEGKRLTHNPRDDVFNIEEPRLSSFGDNQMPINIRAERAMVKQKSKNTQNENDRDEVHLYGKVQVDKPRTNTSNAMKLNSEYILLLPNEYVMKTDKAVSFVTENLEVTAIGMQANNQTQEVHLDSKVRIRLAQNATGSRHSILN